MILLKFEKGGIKGTSEMDGHKDWIEISSFGQSNMRHIQVSGNDRETGRPHVTEVMLTKGTDSASVDLFEQSLTGDSLGKATLRFIQTGGTAIKNQHFLEVTLQQPIISSFSINGDAKGRPMESLQLNFEAITYAYTPFSGDKKGTTASRSYNLKLGTKG